VRSRGKWLTRKETCDLLEALGWCVSPGRLSVIGSEYPEKGPPFMRSPSGRVRYHSDEVRAWMEKKMVRVE